MQNDSFVRYLIPSSVLYTQVTADTNDTNGESQTTTGTKVELEPKAMAPKANRVVGNSESQTECSIKVHHNSRKREKNRLLWVDFSFLVCHLRYSIMQLSNHRVRNSVTEKHTLTKVKAKAHQQAQLELTMPLILSSTESPPARVFHQI